MGRAASSDGLSIEATYVRYYISKIVLPTLMWLLGIWDLCKKYGSVCKKTFVFIDIVEMAVGTQVILPVSKIPVQVILDCDGYYRFGITMTPIQSLTNH